MFFGKETALKAHILHNIPENLWYATTLNGVTRLALARQVELLITPIRRNLKPGVQKPYFMIFVSEFTPTLNFSDNKDLMFHDGSGRLGRMAKGICGNMAELNQFSFTFPVVQGPPIWVPPAETLKGAGGSVFGTIGKLDDFNEVLELGRRYIAESHKQLK